MLVPLVIVTLPSVFQYETAEAKRTRQVMERPRSRHIPSHARLAREYMGVLQVVGADQ